jgi:polysaccharide transporter, PST family
MAIQLGLYGALVASAVYQSITFFITVLLCYKASWFKFSQFFGGIDRQALIDLSKYAAMALTSATCVPVSHIFVRDYLGNTFGWTAAGYWEGSWRLSVAYLMLATTTLSVYYLPKLSELIETSELKKEINQGYKIILPIAAVGGILIYLLRDNIIAILFTPEFYAMRELFAWQIVGDFFKIGSWIPAYLLLGKAMFKTFMISELFFSTSFVILTMYFSKQFGLQGVAIAHATNYFICWIVIALIVNRKLKF